jgi:WD40 repeat protein
VRPALSLALHRDYVTCVEASASLIFSGSCDCTVGVWDHGGALVAQLTGHTDWIFSLVLVQPPPGPGGQPALLSCSRDATLRLWQLGSDGFGDCLRVISTSGSRALSCSLQPGSSLAAVALGNNRVALLDLLDSAARPRVLSGHAGRVTALLWWRNLLVSASLDNSLRVWDTAGNCLVALRAHADSINGASAFSITFCFFFLLGVFVASDVLYSGSDDGTVRMWRLAEMGLEAMNPETPRNKSGVFKGLSLSGKFKSPKTSNPGNSGDK